MSSPPLPERRHTPLVRPVRGHLVTESWAPRVVSPLHDVLTEDERRAMLVENRDSYLHVTSDPVSPPGSPGQASPGAEKAAALRRLLDSGAYRCLTEPAYFVYRMREADAEHTGVVASVDMAGFADGSVLGHEQVQAGRVEALIRHHEDVPLRSELVTLFHRSDAVLTQLVTEIVRRRPVLEFTDVEGIEQSVWQVQPEEGAALAGHLDGHRHYIADGHHRVAAALRCWERDGRPRGTSVLCAVYSQDQVVLHAFHRRVRGPVAVPELLDALGAAFDVRRADGPTVSPGSIGMYAAKRWHLLTPRKRPSSAGVAGLDVTVLQDRILRPLLAVDHGGPRLEFLPDTRELQPATDACDDDGGVLFTLRMPDVDDVIAVAERREVMSAKTTYVKPKPRTGIFLQSPPGGGDHQPPTACATAEACGHRGP
jgi:uncharacterized protein (DUF1015 family)